MALEELVKRRKVGRKREKESYFGDQGCFIGNAAWPAISTYAHSPPKHQIPPPKALVPQAQIHTVTNPLSFNAGDLSFLPPFRGHDRSCIDQS